MKKLPMRLLLLVLLSSPLAFSLAATYKWNDAQGNVVYSQHPPEEGVPYERMDIKSSSRYPTATEPAPSTSTAKKSILDAQKSNEKQAQVEAEVAKYQEIRKKNCEAAKKNLEIYTVYRRIRDDKGVVTSIDDNVRQQKIDEAKQAIKDFCD